MSNKYHLVVDAQILQTRDKDRGMGKFVRSLLQNLVSSDISMTWVITSRLEKLRSEDIALAKSLNAKIVEADLLHASDNAEYKNSIQHNKTAIDQIVDDMDDATEIKYFIPALFSSDIHPVFPSTGSTNLLLFYDLIPFLYFKNYFPDPNSVEARDYAQRFKEFYKADFFATISETTADDLMVYFGVDPQRITLILGAAADRSSLVPERPQGIEGDFVLMPSGDELRKNNKYAAQALSSLDSNLKLVITSKFSEGTKRTLREIYPNIIFTGNVTDAEFLWLLDNAKVVFFPPHYEGLGMPLLEAIERKALVACSNIPVFAEISQKAFFYFDPNSISSMVEALRQSLAVNKAKHIQQVKSEYTRILRKFNWAQVAESFVSLTQKEKVEISKQKLAIFCPSPSSYSSVGKYAFEVHAELSQLFDIDYFAEDGLTALEDTRINILKHATNYYSASSFNEAKLKQYDHILYNLGNSEFHIDTILNSLRYTANAIIHDTKMHGIFDWMERNKFISKERHDLEFRLDELVGTKDSSCLTSIVSNQNKVLCHSDYAKKAISKLTNNKIATIQTIHPIGVPSIQLEKMGGPTISFAGIITEDKGISMVSEIAKNKQVKVKIFGFGIQGDGPLLQNLSDNVHLIKDLTDKEFQDTLRQTDILVNYRPKYNGETSRSTLEAMRHGAVVIVRDIGWYGELPDDTVVKVSSEMEAIAVIEELLANPERRQKIASVAREFLQREYSYSKYAKVLATSLGSS